MKKDENNKSLNQTPANSQTHPNSFPTLLTQREAAKLMRRSVVSFWRMRKKYEIPVYRCGGSALFSLHDLLLALQKMRVEV